MIGYTKSKVKSDSSLAVKGKGGDFRVSEKILPDLDSGLCDIIYCPSAWTLLSAQAFAIYFRIRIRQVFGSEISSPGRFSNIRLTCADTLQVAFVHPQG